jgi:hypothetical protein
LRISEPGQSSMIVLCSRYRYSSGCSFYWPGTSIF